MWFIGKYWWGHLRSFSRTESSISNVFFMPGAHLNSAWPHFKRAVATYGCHVRYGARWGQEEVWGKVVIQGLNLRGLSESRFERSFRWCGHSVVTACPSPPPRTNPTLISSAWDTKMLWISLEATHGTCHSFGEQPQTSRTLLAPWTVQKIVNSLGFPLITLTGQVIGELGWCWLPLHSPQALIASKN